jgi:hypothetical protein
LGLFRHYWVVAKLGLTVVATGLLLLHTQPIAQVAAIAEGGTLGAGELWQLRLQLVGDAAAAVSGATPVAIVDWMRERRVRVTPDAGGDCNHGPLLAPCTRHGPGRALTGGSMEHAHGGKHRGRDAKAGGLGRGREHYGHLGLMLIASFVAMYVLMYAMVDRAGNALGNVNQVYMAALMTAPMALFELVIMRTMYHDTRRNAIIGGAAALVGIGAFVAIRVQAGVGDRQFLRSMIPHHASAILMCEKSHVERPEVRALCEGIIRGQQAEIDSMRVMLGMNR